MVTKSAILLSIGLVAGIIIVGFGVGMIWEFRNIIRDKIIKGVQLTNGSDSYSNWLDPPTTVYMQFWVFNVTNAHEVLDTGAKPHVVEQGPYTYSEIRPKEDVHFLEDGTQLSYRQPKAYVFEPSMSVGSEWENFTTVNLPLLTVATMYPLNKLAWEAALFLTGEKLLDTFSVHGYLFGYEDKTLKGINEFVHRFFKNVTAIKNDKFGLFYGPTGNGTDDGEYVVSTGTADVDSLNQVMEWNGTSTLNYWNSSSCNMINGTDGTLWHPYVKKTDRLYVFSTDICRSIYVTYQESRHELGILLYRFTPPASVFANQTINPDNEGFCVAECLDSGVLDVSGCKGAPIVISQPHFYQGAQQYIDAIDGLHPSEQHETFLDVEPHTGAALNVSKKLQLNAYIKPIPGVTGKISGNIIFPLIWLNESGMMDEATAQKFRQEVLKPMTILNGVQYGIIALGVAIILSITVSYCIRRSRKSEDKIALVSAVDDDPPLRGDL